MTRHQFSFYMKPARLTQALAQLVGDTSAVIAAVTDDGPTLKLEVTPVGGLERFLEKRSVRRLHLLLGVSPKHDQDWASVEKNPDKHMKVELGAFDEKAKTVGPSTAFALPQGAALTLLDAFEKIVKRASNKGVRVKDGQGRVKTKRDYWTPDLEGWSPKGYDTVFREDSA